jgi:hypothetical protein
LAALVFTFCRRSSAEVSTNFNGLRENPEAKRQQRNRRGSAMSDVEFRKRIPLPRNLDPDDYRTPHVRADERELPAMNEIDTGATVNLRKLEERLARKPLDEIAALIQGLTYGEMIELAEVMWKSHQEGSAITQDNLPALLHRWSKSRSAAGNPRPPKD